MFKNTSFEEQVFIVACLKNKKLDMKKENHRKFLKRIADKYSKQFYQGNKTVIIKFYDYVRELGYFNFKK
jgi:hypothetical protein